MNLRCDAQLNHVGRGDGGHAAILQLGNRESHERKGRATRGAGDVVGGAACWILRVGFPFAEAETVSAPAAIAAFAAISKPTAAFAAPAAAFAALAAGSSERVGRLKWGSPASRTDMRRAGCFGIADVEGRVRRSLMRT